MNVPRPAVPTRALQPADPMPLADMVTAWIAASETLFLDAGERLREVHGRLASVRDGIGRATELLSVESMEAMRTGLAAAAEDTRRIGSLSADRASSLGALRAAIRDAAEASSTVRSTFKTLDYVALIARVQVERMRSAQEELVPFAMHVDELVTSGEKVASFVDAGIRTLRGRLEAARGIEEASRSGDVGADLMEGFLRLVALIETQQGAAGGRRDEAGRSFAALWRAVAGVVMGLQAHDMARQRFEHTARNLAMLEAIGRDGDLADGGEALEPELRAAAMRRIALLETAQLDDLAAVYGAKMEGLDADLVRIAAEFGACCDLLDRVVAEDGRGCGLAQLDAEASRLGRGFEHGRRVREEMARSVQDSIEATDALIEMTNRLGDLEYDLRLAGFNAAVRAAQVEGGDETIGYIARVIREQAASARVEADRVHAGIGQAVEATRDLSQRILPGIAAAEASIERVLIGAARHMADSEASSRAALTQSAAAAQGLGPKVEAVRETMRAHEEGCAMMRGLSAALAARLHEWPQADLPEAQAERLDRLLVAPYTMDEERQVYGRVFGRPLAPPAPPSFDDELF